MHRTIRFARLAAGWAVVCLLVFSSACGGSHDDADAGRRYVDPPIVDKTFLIPATYARLEAGTNADDFDLASASRDPRFYFARTWVSGPTDSFAGVSRSSPLRVIRFEVTENFLLARAVPAEWERTGVFPTVTDGPSSFRGDVVAAYRIESHFDVSAHVAAGEGAVAERDVRPWYRRRYMRVDWSQNLAGSVDSRWPDLADVPSEPLPVSPSSTDDSPAQYFAPDFSNFYLRERVLLHPERARLPPGSPRNMNACELLDHERREACGPLEWTYRVAFRRRDREREMSPNFAAALRANHAVIVPTDDRFPTYDADEMDIPNQGPVRVAARRDLFSRDHMVATVAVGGSRCNADRDCPSGEVCKTASVRPDADHRGLCAAVVLAHLSPTAVAPSIQGTDPPCVTDDDCRIGGVSAISSTARCDDATHTCGEPFIRCDSDTDCNPRFLGSCDRGIAAVRPDHHGLCFEPLRSRAVEPIAIHLASDVPADLEPAVRRAFDDWNAALRRVVVQARRRECQIDEFIDGADPSSDSEPRCNDPQVLGLGPGGDAERLVVACHSPVWGVLSGPGAHSAADVADAHAHGFDLDACGPQGTVATAGDIRFDTIASSRSPSDELLWTSVNADPFDGRIVGTQAFVSFARLEALAGVWQMRLQARVGDVLGPSATIDLSDGAVISGPILDAPFGRPGARERMMQAYLPMEDASSTNIYVPTGTGVPSALLEARFALSGGTSLGSRVLDPELANLVSVDTRAASSEVVRLASPFMGEGADVRAARRAYQRRVAGSECGLRYLRGDVALDPAIERLRLETPVDCGEEPDLCVQGPPPVADADSDAIRRYARLRLAKGIFTHAIGHLLGLPHNLAGSADVLNYPDRYWQVRGHGHAHGIEPRYVSLGRAEDGRYESAEEDARRTDYATSSVMDLVDPQTAASGVGRADVAALASLYTRTAEAFRAVDAENAFAQHVAASSRRGTFGGLDLSRWQQGIVHRTHYDQIPEWFAHNPDGTPAIGDTARFVVFTNETLVQPVTGWGDPLVSNRELSDHWLVPYRAISEDDDVIGWPAIPFDRGGDEFESARSLARRWIEGRGFDASDADAWGVSPFAYLDDVRARFVEPMRAISGASLPSEEVIHAYSRSALARTAEDDVAIASAALVMNTMLGQLSVPEAGQYSRGTALDGTPRFVFGLTPTLQLGRFIESRFSPDGSLDLVGSWFDKLAAIDGAHDTLDSFRRPDLSITIDADLVTLFPNAALRFAGGMLADDLADVGPTVRTSNIRFPDVMSLASFPGPGPAENGRGGTDEFIAIDAGVRDSHAALMDAHQIARWSVLGDRRFVRFAAVWTDDERAVPAEPTVSFDDALTGRTYRAFHISGARGGEAEAVGYSAMIHAATGMVSDEAGVTARAILHLQDLAAVRDRAANAAFRSRVDRALRDAIDRLEAFRIAQRALEAR